jgi:hypothetical protein
MQSSAIWDFVTLTVVGEGMLINAVICGILPGFITLEADGELQTAALEIHTTALVDSGADDTVFPVSYAKALGIDLTSLPVTETRGVGAQRNITYRATVTLGIIFCGHEYSYRSAVAFIAGDSELLGQSGFLDHFRVTLDRTKKQFVIQSVDIQADAASQSPAEFERIDQRLQELEASLNRLTILVIQQQAAQDQYVRLWDYPQSELDHLDFLKERLAFLIKYRAELASIRPAEKRLAL